MSEVEHKVSTEADVADASSGGEDLVVSSVAPLKRDVSEDDRLEMSTTASPGESDAELAPVQPSTPPCSKPGHSRLASGQDGPWRRERAVEPSRTPSPIAKGKRMSRVERAKPEKASSIKHSTTSNRDGRRQAAGTQGRRHRVTGVSQPTSQPESAINPVPETACWQGDLRYDIPLMAARDQRNSSQTVVPAAGPDTLLYEAQADASSALVAAVARTSRWPTSAFACSAYPGGPCPSPSSVPARVDGRVPGGAHGLWRIHVSGLPRGKVTPVWGANWTESIFEEDCLRHFLEGQRCQVAAVRLMVDPKTSNCRGFAFVDFEEEVSFRTALSLDGKPLEPLTTAVRIMIAK